MPAIITHHLFGEDASALLPDNLLADQEDLLAFLLGNQGPDPYFARILTTPKTARACHELAARIHEQRVVNTFMALRDSVSYMREGDKTIARAFALGMAAHYLLDSMVHPFIHAQQAALVEASPELVDADSELHALLESDIDAWMLWQKRQQTVLDVSCASMLAHTEHIDRVAGAALSQVAWEVFDLEVGAAEYGRAVRDYQLLYRAIDPPHQRLPKALSRAEELIRPHSRLRAQAHEVFRGDDCPAANLDHQPWRHPSTGEVSFASLPDLFHDALLAWPTFARRFVEGDRARLEAMVATINYNGCPEG